MEPPTFVPPKTAGSYVQPAWSALPPPGYSLEVIKNGLVVEEIPLKDREFFRVGRQHDIVDIPMDHGSISRLHAIFNFSKDGALMLIDNKSANGTFINKQRIAPNEYQRLKVGDVVKFGESTRIYVLQGPPEDSREEEEDEKLRQLRQRAEAKALERKQRQEAEEKAGASWGMMDNDDEIYATMRSQEEREDEEAFKSSSGKGSGGQVDETTAAILRYRQRQSTKEDDPEDDRFRSGDGGIHGHRYKLPGYLQQDDNYDRKYGDKFSVDIDESTIKSDKDRDLLDKIRKKELKIQHMQEEIKRIYLKEHQQEDGLTTGQQQTVARNDKAIADLTADIDDLLKRLRQKHEDRTAGTAKASGAEDGGNLRSKRPRADEDSDDTQLLDTSNQTADVNTNWRLKKKLSKLSTTAHHVVSSSSAPQHQPHQHQASSLSYKGIKANYDLEMHRLTTLQASLLQQQQTLSILENSSTSSAGNSEEDAVNTLILRDQRQEAKQKLQRLQSDVATATLQTQQLQKLLVAATPALKSLTTTTSQQASSSSTKAAEAADLSQTSSNGASHHPEAVPTSQSNSSVVASNKIGKIDKEDEDNEAAARERQQLDTLMEIEQFNDTLRRQEEAEAAAARATTEAEARLQSTVNKPVASTVYASVASSSSMSTSKKVVPQGPSRAPALPTTAPATAVSSTMLDHAVQQGLLRPTQVLEGGEMSWVPPKQQRGDGKTALNAKLGY